MRSGDATKARARRKILLNTAVSIASQPGGWAKLTRRAIAKQSECSEGLVSLYLGDVPTIRRTVMKTAIREGIVCIIIQSMAAHDGYAVARWLPKSLRTKAINSLLGQ